MTGRKPLLIHPELFHGVPDLIALQTTRVGGRSEPPFDTLNLGMRTADNANHLQENLKRLCDYLGISPESIVLSYQVHGTEICLATEPGSVCGYDALMTDQPGLFLGIATADCYPLLIHDPKNSASAAVHAGWQGTQGGIALKTVRAMQTAFGTDPGDCLAWVGTGIAAANYEVGDEVAAKFNAQYLGSSPGAPGKSLLDLSAANCDQLLAAGIPQQQVACSSCCSFRDHDLFYSYRRDLGHTGRMLSLIGIRTPSAVAS